MVRPEGARALPTLQERKQEFVRTELADAAWGLFARKGYEATTVAEIADAAGVSRRTFFRYYASKEEVLVATSDAVAEEMLAAVAARPRDEAALLAIKHALVPVLERSLADVARSRAIIRLLRESPSLRRAMLDRHARMEERLAEHLAERLGSDTRSDSTPALLAFVARAMLDTAFNVWYDQRRDDIPALVEELFERLAEHVPSAVAAVAIGSRGRKASRRKA
jgi:AcrR family transcriptional regulator